MGIKEKKQIREITEFLEAEGLGMLKHGCGSTTLEAEYVCDEAMVENEIRNSLPNLKDFITGFITVCEDADYKEEIAKVEKVVFNCKAEVERNTNPKIYGHLTLEGNVMTLLFDGKHNLSNNDKGNIRALITNLY